MSGALSIEFPELILECLGSKKGRTIPMKNQEFGHEIV